MATRPLLLSASLLCFHAASFANGLPDYIRYAEDAKTDRLEVAIRSFGLPSGQKVDLIGVVHIADRAYYQELNRRFDTYDSVLFEMVGDPGGVTAKAPPSEGSTITQMQQAAGQYLELTFQLDAIDYSRKNMVHADTSWEQFQAMQKQRGETMMTLFGRAMQAQMHGRMNNAAADQLDGFGLIRILMSPDSASEFKRVLAKMFDQMESMTAAMEGKDGTAALSGRNDVAVKKLSEVLADRKQRRVAVFYDAAHMPGIEALLLKDLKAKASSEEWLAAWTMPHPSAPLPATATATATAK